jgi:cob(I)alamin adenosyltransferase
LIILEEFNIALRDGFVKYSEFERVLKNADNDTYVFVTGRGAPKSLVKRADLVTEMKEIKHPYKKGVKAKKGIEF